MASPNTPKPYDYKRSWRLVHPARSGTFMHPRPAIPKKGARPACSYRGWVMNCIKHNGEGRR